MRKYKLEQLNLLLCLFCVVRRRIICLREMNVVFLERVCNILCLVLL